MSGHGAPRVDRIDGTGLRVVIVAGSWHDTITDGLIAGAERVLEAAGASWRLVRVPGSFELPVASKVALDAGADAVVALVKVLRFTYRTNEIFLPIKDELEFIRDYVKVQRMRFGEKIEVEYEWDKRIERYYTLKFIIQPIVENAMIHGLANKSYNGLIVVRGVLDEANRQIRFEIEDNGVGFAPKRKDQMSGVGMSNVNDRIRMHFGEQYGLTVEKPLRLHTRIVITIPILTEGKVV